MSQAAPRTIAVAKALEEAMRVSRGRLVASLAAGFRDIALAEEALQEASVSALAHWGRAGLPQSPEAWLLTVARRKALDRLRATRRDASKFGNWALLVDERPAPAEDIPDDRLRLIFACCHPSLEMKSRVALTLRTVCGLTTGDIARAFLDQEATMGQRLSRAKTKIAEAGIPFAIPSSDLWPARLEAVLTTLYLIFTTGYVAGPDEPRDLCAEAEFLGRMMASLQPDEPEIEGLQALMLLTSARRAARIGADGASVPPTDQDRTLWDQTKIAEGRALLATALARKAVGPFQIKAAIADCQTHEPGPDWPQICALYTALLRFEPTPIVRLNAAVATAEAGMPDLGLELVESLAEALSDFLPWRAARAALLAKVGRTSEAALAYALAREIADTASDRLFLEKRQVALEANSEPH